MVVDLKEEFPLKIKKLLKLHVCLYIQPFWTLSATILDQNCPPDVQYFDITEETNYSFKPKMSNPR